MTDSDDIDKAQLLSKYIWQKVISNLHYTDLVLSNQIRSLKNIRKSKRVTFLVAPLYRCRPIVYGQHDHHQCQFSEFTITRGRYCVTFRRIRYSCF